MNAKQLRCAEGQAGQIAQRTDLYAKKGGFVPPRQGALVRKCIFLLSALEKTEKSEKTQLKKIKRNAAKEEKNLFLYYSTVF